MMTTGELGCERSQNVAGVDLAFATAGLNVFDYIELRPFPS